MTRALMVSILLMTALPATADTATAPCNCIASGGEKVPLGQVACLTVGGRSFLARCAMSLNLLTWRKITDGCPVSALPMSVAPQG